MTKKQLLNFHKIMTWTYVVACILGFSFFCYETFGFEKECNTKVIERFDECLDNVELEHKKCLALFGDKYCLKRLESFVDACIDTANLGFDVCRELEEIEK